jgi:hypothetical protein
MSVTPLPRDPEDEQRERAPRRSSPPAPGQAPSVIDSFNYAFEGIIHVLRTQRNLRIHFLAAVLVHHGGRDRLPRLPERGRPARDERARPGA